MLSVYGIDQVLGGASDGSRIDGSQWAAAAAFAAVAVGVFVRGGSPWRQRTLALAVLIAASYGAVAIGRSPLIPPLSLLYVATAPRYHYPATALLAALVGLLVYRVGAGIRLPPGITRLALALWLAAIATRVAWRSPAEDLTAAGRPALDYALGAMRDRIAAAPDGATVYIENRPFAGVAAFTRPAVFPGWAALYAIFHADWETASRRVLFIDADPAVRANADRSPRAAGLIVAPDDVPIELRPAPVAGSPPPG
ncbi:MAG: hypothetical protein SF182_18285 [Deltaproteobacteria bacterium]|nr:hypothetical protein [Deltaproteobacteria bacterium]